MPGITGREAWNTTMHYSVLLTMLAYLSIKLPSVQMEEEKEHRVHNCHEGGNYPNGSKLVFGSDCQLVVVVVIAVFSALAHIYCL